MEYVNFKEIEEKLMDDIYIYGVETAGAAMAEAEMTYEESIGSPVGFDKWSIFHVKTRSMSLMEAYLMDSVKLTPEERLVLEAWNSSDLRVCEVVDRSGKEFLILKDVASGESFRARADESVEKGELVIGRIFFMDEEFYVSGCLSVFIDRKLSETVKGKLREIYESHCKVEGYSTYENYLKSNPWVLYKIIEVAETPVAPLEEDEMDVFSLVYAMADPGRVKETIKSEGIFVPCDEEAGVSYYFLMDEDGILCEVEVHPRLLIANINERDEIERVQKRLEDLFAGAIVLTDTHAKTIGDLTE